MKIKELKKIQLDSTESISLRTVAGVMIETQHKNGVIDVGRTIGIMADVHNMPGSETIEYIAMIEGNDHD